MTKDSNTDELYDIGFVDPHEIVDFIQDETSSAADEESTETRIHQSEEEESLPYTTQIIEDSQDYVIKKQEDTRGRLAVIYTIFTFLIFLIAFVVAILDGLVRHVSIVENIMTILPLISGIFLGTLGFVIGYYFKKEDI